MTSAALEAAVNAIDPSWLEKAGRRTEKFRHAGAYGEASAIWSDVKPVFIDLQRNKCAFCERQFESVEYGRIEFDLEHYRPKSAVSAWPDAGRHPHLRYTFATGGGGPGYYWLAYELGNYAAACKICNSIFKHDFFPIEGPRGPVGGTPLQLAAEEPLLCYPIGDSDDDPEELITFIVTTAKPRQAQGRPRRRAQVIIDLFGLNAREDLHRERARLIAMVGTALVNIADGRGEDTDDSVIRLAADPRVPHASCVRSFMQLWDADELTARQAYRLCRVYGLQELGGLPPELQ